MVLGVAATLKRAGAHPRLARRMARTKGVIALRSSVDKQAVTIRFEGGRVVLGPGVARDAGVVVTLDFNNMSGPDAPKPKVTGALRHPMLALAAAKLLDPPTGTWREEAAKFWAFAASSEPRLPASVQVVCTDGAELRLGSPDGPAQYEIEGSAAALVSVFSGATTLGEDYLNGRIRAVGTFEHGSVLTGRSIAWVLGEGR